MYITFQLIFNKFFGDQQLNPTKNDVKMKKFCRLKSNFDGVQFGKSCHEVLHDIKT
jgi:hypothetical protein